LRRFLVIAVLAAVALAGVNELAETTMTRPDPVVPGSTSEITFEVVRKGYLGSEHEAGRALWAACAGTIRGTEPAPGLVPLGGARFRVSVAPALGPNGLDRIRGCLEDATVDRLTGTTVSISRHAPLTDSAGTPGE
jgi:hypothetical protein